MNTDAKFHSSFRRQFTIALQDLGLNLFGAAHRFDRAGKLGDDAVAGGIEYPPVMGTNQAVKDAATDAERVRCPLFILAHEAAVPDHIGSQNRRQFSLYLHSLVHGWAALFAQAI